MQYFIPSRPQSRRLAPPRRPSGFLHRLSCWALAFAGARLQGLGIALARRGLLGRRQLHMLLGWAAGFNRQAIRRLRRG